MNETIGTPDVLQQTKVPDKKNWYAQRMIDRRETQAVAQPDKRLVDFDFHKEKINSILAGHDGALLTHQKIEDQLNKLIMPLDGRRLKAYFPKDVMFYDANYHEVGRVPEMSDDVLEGYVEYNNPNNTISKIYFDSKGRPGLDPPDVSSQISCELKFDVPIPSDGKYHAVCWIPMSDEVNSCYWYVDIHPRVVSTNDPNTHWEIDTWWDLSAFQKDQSGHLAFRNLFFTTGGEDCLVLKKLRNGQEDRRDKHPLSGDVGLYGVHKEGYILQTDLKQQIGTVQLGRSEGDNAPYKNAELEVAIYFRQYIRAFSVGSGNVGFRATIVNPIVMIYPA